MEAVAKRRALGRGLGALIPGAFEEPRTVEESPLVRLDSIRPSRVQPRQSFSEASIAELADSIREKGIIQPLLVRPSGDGYELIAGERRLRAAQSLGLESVPVTIRAVDDREALELALIENIQRENLNPIETARAYSKLQDQFGLTQREIAVRVGKSREAVANAIRLLNLPTQIQDAVSGSKINESQARLLLMIADPKEQQLLFEDLILNNLSVRQLRTRIMAKKEAIARPVDSVMPDVETAQIEEQLREALGTKVRVQKEGQGGKVTINYYSPEELQGIIDKLTKAKESFGRHLAVSETPASADLPMTAEASVMPSIAHESPTMLHEWPASSAETPNEFDGLPDLSAQKPDFTV